ncbi:carboxypeptidase cpdS precursor [Lasiosphaeria ovina]|uniref:Carboxypeptidase n=1 Tax=Lasiosphaeria ovina TaxID=92902 RepID=A0AAE0JW54_9PEZI|nr:carboxypeptidase cpdS precursor [Lasiosphaeria ovina]
MQTMNRNGGLKTELAPTSLRALLALLAFLCHALLVAAYDTSYFRDVSKRQGPFSTDFQPHKAIVADKISPSPFHNANTTKFAVNGSAIPEIDFDVGESYSGQLPVGGDSDGNLFFWFFPTVKPDRPKEILLWLNGGPGCSSFEGLMQENGPISWQPGTIKPVRNVWSWHRLTNVVWVEQPVGTGFSTGNVTAKDEDDVAKQFMGFWKNFIDTFSMQGYKVYITGESYAGMYCPYIASNFLDANETTPGYFDVQGMLIYDPAIAYLDLLTVVPMASMVKYWGNALPLNETARAGLQNMSAACGFDAYMDKYLTFPPPGPQGDFWSLYPEGSIRYCQTSRYVEKAVVEINPAFNIYQLTQLSPILYDPLGFSNQPGGDTSEVFFNRRDVKEALHAPLDVEWAECSGPVFAGGADDDLSDPSVVRALPSVIDRTKNVIIAHGAQDLVLLANGTLLAIQNMTWGGKLGFQTPPRDPLFVPYHDAGYGPGRVAGSGVLGTTHTERGLTWNLVPEWQPAVAFRQVEFLLGRIKSLNSTQPFTIFPQTPQPDAAVLGQGLGITLAAEAAVSSAQQSGGGQSSGDKPSAASSSFSNSLWRNLTAATTIALLVVGGM